MIEYKQVNFPKIPDYFVKEIILNLNRFLELNKEFIESIDTCYDWYYSNDNEKNTLYCKSRNDLINSLQRKNYDEIDPCVFEEYPVNLPKNFQTWIKENISEKSEGRVYYFTRGTVILPHIDGQRKDLSYNYIINKGGENVKNVFYEPKTEFKNYKIKTPIYCPYEKIQKTGELDIPESSWYQFDSGKIHSVENIDKTKTRIIVTVSENWWTTKKDYGKIIKKIE